MAFVMKSVDPGHVELKNRVVFLEKTLRVEGPFPREGAPIAFITRNGESDEWAKPIKEILQSK